MARYWDQGGTLDSSFTWVHHKYRRRGIGVEMWKRAVKRTGARKLMLTPVTKGGDRLVARIKASGFVKVKVLR